MDEARVKLRRALELTRPPFRRNVVPILVVSKTDKLFVRQGQRTLSRLQSKDFGEKAVIPSRAALLCFDALFGRMLLK